ncbi:uncharacterized protein LOC116352087 isoform X2 [Contarinia nasturtii]|uniref:uncharacterized protein LOC116352087 isoform X2 n=1 Tax=Contarinia nasturtii TaxID=265458 RepID=UPI0012D479D5|nr:uncharacterized protein LOC116352087 isoform X2 [Contarinia nasturtii]
MSTTYIFVIITAIAAFFTVMPTLTFAATLERRTKFIIYDNKNTEVMVSTSRDDVLEDALADCWPTKKYAIIVPGWRESCNTSWTIELREKLIANRGGCIICMDYRDYNEDYGFLLVNFKTIANLLTDKLKVLRELAFDSSSSYLFGFSFGARLIAKAATDLGTKQIGTIHLCEPAGPGFDGLRNADPKMAAVHSQCIHTASGGYGTRERTCHQNWNMGNCGESQIGQRPFPLGNHGLCPVFYISAFDNVFAAVKKTEACQQPINERDAINLPHNQTIRMGYYQNVSSMIDLNETNLYAITSRDPPFN